MNDNINIKEILKSKEKTDEFILNNKGLVIDVIKKTYPSVLNTNDEEDYIQEGLMYFYRAMKNYDETKAKNISFSTFAFHAVRKRFIDKLRMNESRKRKNKRIISLYSVVSKHHGEDKEIELIDVIPNTTNIENEVIDRDIKKRIIHNINNKLIHNLKPGHREVLMYLIKGKTQADIARIMNCSRENIRQKVNRIREKARKLDIAS